MITFTIIITMISILAILTSMDIFNEEMLEDSINDWQDNAMVQCEHERLVAQYVMYAEESIQYRQALGWDTDDEPTQWEEDTQEYELPLSEYADEYTDDDSAYEHEALAQSILVYGVWGYNILKNLGPIKLGLVDPASLDPRLAPLATLEQDMSQGTGPVQGLAQCVTALIHAVQHTARELEGMCHDVRHQVQQVVWYYQASKAKDITPTNTKHMEARANNGGMHTPVLVQASYTNIVVGE